MANEGEDAAVGTLTLKLPTFWPEKPEAWFVQAEANFQARRISSQKTQFNLVVVALDADTIDGVLDLLENPPDDNAYDQLKNRLVQSFKMSPVEKIKRELEFPALAEENPVKLADKIMALTREANSEDIAKTVFLLKLPDRRQEDHVGGTTRLVDRHEIQGERAMARWSNKISGQRLRSRQRQQAGY